MAKNVCRILTSLAVSIAVMLATSVRAADPAAFTIVTGKPGGIYHSLGRALAEAMTTRLADTRVAVRPGSTAWVNLGLIRSGTIESAFARSITAYQAFQGTDQFTKAPVANIRGIASLYPDAIQIVTRRTAGIHRLSDLKGKNVILGERNSSTAMDASLIIKAAAMGVEDFGRVDWLGFEDLSRLIQEQQGDAGFITAGIPTASVMELASVSDIRLLSLDNAMVKTITDAYPFYTSLVIPPDTYIGQTAPVTSVAVMTQWVCRAEADEAVVYRLTRALWEPGEKVVTDKRGRQQQAPSVAELLARNHAKGKDVTLATALAAMAIPLHPGAERYYREKGLIK